MINNQLNQSLNTSVKSLICNHCSYEFANYNDMKEHYKSQFHLYNLHRVTMQLNPVNYEEYLKKKETLEKSKVKPVVVKSQVQQPTSNYCEACSKAFASINKLNEHLNSKSHKANKVLHEEKLKKEREKIGDASPPAKPKQLTCIDNYLICFVCNDNESKTTDDVLAHLKEKHSFEFPVSQCLVKREKALKLIAKKIFKFGACLYCDSQKFPNPKAIQSHMRDTNHIKINYEDIIEHFYKHYDKNRIIAVEGVARKSKEFQLIKRMIVPKKGEPKRKEVIDPDYEEIEEVDDEDVDINTTSKAARTEEEAVVSDEEDEMKNIDYVRMENGEIMLKDGTILGNKIYKNVYMQRVKVVAEWKDNQHTRLLRIKAMSAKRKLNKLLIDKKGMFSHWTLTGSKKGLFTRINTLHKIRKQVNC